MLATSALHLSDNCRRQIACHPGAFLSVGRGDNHMGPNEGCTGGGGGGGRLFFPLKGGVLFFGVGGGGRGGGGGGGGGGGVAAHLFPLK